MVALASFDIDHAKSFIFMKVGNHAGEPFEKIIERKRKERRDAGFIFWGYGGSACHPLSQVQPFLKFVARDGEIPYLLMQNVRSNDDQDRFAAEEYSLDGVHWQPIPRGITVTGSRYALVLDEVCPGDFILDVGQYEIGIGPSRGKIAHEYLQGRTDKACLRRLESSPVAKADPKQMKQIDFVATLKEPYAVMLR